MSFVYVDGEAQQLIKILSDRLSKNIKEDFLVYSLQNRRQVECVIIDLNANYGQFVRGLFPNAKIIINRFHIIQRVAQGLTGQHVEDQRSVEDKQHPREYAIMKSKWCLFIWRKRIDDRRRSIGPCFSIISNASRYLDHIPGRFRGNARAKYTKIL